MTTTTPHLGLSSFKVLIISSDTPNAVSTVLTDGSKGLAHGFDHIIHFDYDEFLVHGYARELDRNYYVFMINEYLYSHLVEVFTKETANHIVAQFMSRIEWNDALLSNVAPAVLNMFYASMYKTCECIEETRKVSESNLVRADGFQLALRLPDNLLRADDIPLQI